MEEKIKLIDDYINKLQAAIDCADIQAADRLQDEVIAIFGSEINSIREGLDNYGYRLIDGYSVDFLGDAAILKGKLNNFKANLRSGLHFSMQRQDGLNITQQVTQQIQNEINVSFEQTISSVQELSDATLSDEEKDILCGKLTAIETAKDKTSKWEKAQSALKWIADKGIEVGIAALPYIAKAIKKAGIL